jgi:hypothetical protein
MLLVKEHVHATSTTSERRGREVFAPEIRELINRVAYELSRQGKPQREALFLVIDPRKKGQLEEVLKLARSRQKVVPMPEPARAA